MSLSLKAVSCVPYNKVPTRLIGSEANVGLKHKLRGSCCGGMRFSLTSQSLAFQKSELSRTDKNTAEQDFCYKIL